MYISIDDVVRRKRSWPKMPITTIGTLAAGKSAVWVCWIEYSEKDRDVCCLQELENVVST